jgi:hypothetical protein
MDHLQAWDARLIRANGYDGYQPYTKVIPLGRHH